MIKVGNAKAFGHTMLQVFLHPNNNSTQTLQELFHLLLLAHSITFYL